MTWNVHLDFSSENLYYKLSRTKPVNSFTFHCPTNWWSFADIWWRRQDTSTDSCRPKNCSPKVFSLICIGSFVACLSNEKRTREAGLKLRNEIIKCVRCKTVQDLNLTFHGPSNVKRDRNMFRTFFSVTIFFAEKSRSLQWSSFKMITYHYFCAIAWFWEQF